MTGMWSTKRIRVRWFSNVGVEGRCEIACISVSRWKLDEVGDGPFFHHFFQGNWYTLNIIIFCFQCLWKDILFSSTLSWFGYQVCAGRNWVGGEPKDERSANAPTREVAHLHQLCLSWRVAPYKQGIILAEEWEALNEKEIKGSQHLLLDSHVQLLLKTSQRATAT